MANHSFDIYRKITLLHAKDILLSDVLRFVGFHEIYVYGMGELGRVVLSDLSGSFSVLGIFDRCADEMEDIAICKKTSTDNEEKIYKYPVLLPDEIPDDSIPVLITPASFYYEIRKSLAEQGIKESRLLSLNLLLYYGMHFKEDIGKGDKICYFPNKEFLIVGGQFSNIGSQSMIFIAVSEIKKRYKDALVWFCPNFWDEEYDSEDKYKILFLTDGRDVNSTLYELLPRLDGIIDVSGYALASHGVINESKRYMDYLRMAKEFEIPFYIMPQSFGPFDYDDATKVELKCLLSFAKVIYAREQAGYNLLIDTFQLGNVKHSMDIVLQNKEIDLSKIYSDIEKSKKIKKDYQLLTENNVAIIPNKQNYKYGNKDEVLQLYIDIIDKVLSFGHEVYIVSYSEDSGICEDIYRAVQEYKKVHYYIEKFDCISFGPFISNFQYIIASRFHAVVYAYKMHRPCIVIGWAEKYRELAKAFSQGKYVFDVRERIKTNEILHAVSQMERRYLREEITIARTLPGMQAENCFDILG